MHLAKYRQELNKLTEFYLSTLSLIADKEWNYKPSEEKWSKKEILGHLIDSAHVNYDRFVRMQLEETIDIHYQQDEWVRIQGYQTHPNRELILTWERLNNRISCLLSNMPAKELAKATEAEHKNNIEDLLESYLEHMRHHLKQITEK